MCSVQKLLHSEIWSWDSTIKLPPKVLQQLSSLVGIMMENPWKQYTESPPRIIAITDAHNTGGAILVNSSKFLFPFSHKWPPRLMTWLELKVVWYLVQSLRHLGKRVSLLVQSDNQAVVNMINSGRSKRRRFYDYLLMDIFDIFPCYTHIQARHVHTAHNSADGWSRVFQNHLWLFPWAVFIPW